MILYQPNPGYVRLAADKAERYRKAVDERMRSLIADTIA